MTVDAPTIRFRREITPQRVEDQLRGHSPFVLEHGPAPWLRASELRLDLSSVEYADFGALAQLLLLVEATVRRGIPVWVALPLPRRRRGEQRWLDSLADEPALQISQQRILRQRVHDRQGAVRFMRQVDFVGALRCDHVPGADELVVIDATFDRSDEQSDRELDGGDEAERARARSEAPPDPRPPAPRPMVRLQWVTVATGTRRDAWEEEIGRLLLLRGVSLSASDARGLARVVVRELLDNVADHAGEEDGVLCAPAALIGGIRATDLDEPGPVAGARRETADYVAWLQDAGQPVLRLVVGDSGRGILATLPLDPSWVPPRRHSREEPWSTTEKTLLWALTPWSTGHGDRRGSSGVRGLASVRRSIARSNGALVIRSGTAVVAVVHPRQERRNDGNHGMAWMPGTLLDVAISPEAATPLPRALPGAPASVIAHMPLAPSGSGPSTPERVVAQLRRTPASDGLVVLVGDVDEELEQAYADLLGLVQLADEVADEAAVVLLAHRQSATSFASTLRAFDNVRERRHESADTPVMVLDERGACMWVGVSEVAENVLMFLASNSSRSCDRSELASRVNIASPVLDDTLSRLGRWVSVEGEHVRLRTEPRAIVNALAVAAAQDLGAAQFATVRTPARGADLLTPALARVSRWVSASRAVRLLGDGSLGGHLLGMQMPEEVFAVAGQELGVVSVGGVPDEVLDRLMATIGAGRRPIRLTGEVGLADDPSAPLVAADANFVFVTDVLLTGNHVRHAIHDLVRAGARPLAIAALIDARRNCENKSLTALGQKLPVVSLAHIPLEKPESDRPVEYVNPGTTSSGAGILPGPQPCPIATKTMLEMCAEVPGSLLIGHVARRARRHFSSYLDVTVLLRDKTIRGCLAAAACGEIAEWLAGQDGAIERLVFMHPGATDDAAGLFASAIVEAWAESGEGPPVLDVLPLERMTLPRRSAMMPPAQPLVEGEAAVVLDWGAVTLHTVYELMQIAADCGAHAVLALVLASQLNDEDKTMADRLRAVGGRAATADGHLPFAASSSLDREVSARVRFVVDFRVGFSAAAECDTCRIVREHRELAHAAPTATLREYGKRVAERLEIADLKARSDEGPVDALGVRIEHDDAVAMVRARQRLVEAESSTRRRAELREKLKEERPEQLDALVRALALEPSWLKAAPLRFSELRTVLVERLLGEMLAERHSERSESLQRQYAIVLRGVSKVAFLEHCPALVVHALRDGERDVVAQLLLGLYSLTTRPYHGSVEDLQRFRTAFQRIATAIADDAGLARAQLGSDVAGSVETLRNDVDYRLGATIAEGVSAQRAWLALIDEHRNKVSTHEAGEKISNVQVGIGLRGEGRPVEEWLRVVEGWAVTARFLARHALPWLPAVRDIVLALLYEQAEDNVEDVERFRLASTPAAVAELEAVDSLLREFVENPDRAIDKHEEINLQVNWWASFFFKQGTGLLRMLEQCPTDVVEVVRAAVEQATAADPAGRGLRAVAARRPLAECTVTAPGPIRVFCHPQVITGVLSHLVRNATELKHAAAGIDPRAPVRMRIEVVENGDAVAVRVRNDTTKVTSPGYGFRTLGRQLGHYGGSLRGAALNPAAEDGYTYEAVLELMKWERAAP